MQRLGFSVGQFKKKRVLILSDIKSEADDPYAFIHHLLSPTEEVREIIACHSESKFDKSPALAWCPLYNPSVTLFARQESCGFPRWRL